MQMLLHLSANTSAMPMLSMSDIISATMLLPPHPFFPTQEPPPLLTKHLCLLKIPTCERTPSPTLPKCGQTSHPGKQICHPNHYYSQSQCANGIRFDTGISTATARTTWFCKSIANAEFKVKVKHTKWWGDQRNFRVLLLLRFRCRRRPVLLQRRSNALCEVCVSDCNG